MDRSQFTKSTSRISLSTLSLRILASLKCYLIQLRSIICASLFKSTMSNLVHVMTRDYLDTNIIANDKNLVIMIPFMLCCVSWTSLI